jgi:hypothetical protein
VYIIFYDAFGIEIMQRRMIGRYMSDDEVRRIFKGGIVPQLIPEIGTSSIDWAQLNRFHLKTETD